MKLAAELEGRSILITGAAGGIGLACARRLAAAGARLLLADLDGHAVGRLASELGPDHIPIQADGTSSADIRRMV
ncbi:MAG: SDR family NAD(P)-dependent oxidoreductase, partial [bacterium]